MNSLQQGWRVSPELDKKIVYTKTHRHTEKSRRHPETHIHTHHNRSTYIHKQNHMSNISTLKKEGKNYRQNTKGERSV